MDTTQLQFEDCSDSTGKVMAEKGNGHWVMYSDDFTRIIEQGKIKNGVKDSIWTETTTGNNPHPVRYDNGKKIEVAVNYKNSASETIPEFPGGLDAFIKFLSSNVHYPRTAAKNGTQGRVIISFVVERDGSLTEIKVIRGIGDGCDEEAVRVLKLSPKWTPGMQNGKPVRVIYSVPIAFNLTR